jgi:preprotein translocase subunit YajC
MPGIFAATAPLFAQGTAPAGGVGSSGIPLNVILMIVAFAAWFYILLIRPGQKQEKERRQMLEALKKNDRVLTTAGIYGTVSSVESEGDRVVLRIGEDQGVRVAFTKGSIVRVLDASSEKEKEKTTGTV